MNAGSLPGRVAVVDGGLIAAGLLRIDYLGAVVLVTTTLESNANARWHQNGVASGDKLRGIFSAGPSRGVTVPRAEKHSVLGEVSTSRASVRRQCEEHWWADRLGSCR